MKLASSRRTVSRRAAISAWLRARRIPLQVATLAAGVYATMILIMWAPYSIFSGFPYETGLIYSSEVHPGSLGFYYIWDGLRAYESNFYHLSYLLGEMLHVGGSYVPYQVVYAALWWARGFLVFLLIRRFMPNRMILAYAAGALVLVHASDGALQWVGQMNQVGYIFWTLAAFLALTMALEARWHFSILWTILAVLLEHRALWSYESEIFLILLFPLVLILHPRRGWGKLAALAVAWYIVPAIYIYLTIRRYSSNHVTYQQSVVRQNWSIGSIASDWWFNISFSLEFWKWVRGPWNGSVRLAELLSVMLAVVFLAGGIVIMRLWSTCKIGTSEFDFRRSSLVLICGLSVLVFSFPVYLILESARGLWRTQLLSGIGAGIVLASVAGLLAMAVRSTFWRIKVFLLLGSIIAFEGSLAAIRRGAVHRFIWERHRTAIREVLQVAPQVPSGTVIAFTNIPDSANDPFGDNMWFDLAVRLIYPNKYVAGAYFCSNGNAGPGENLAIHEGQWIWNGKGIGPLVRKAPISQTIVIRYSQSGQGRLETIFPANLCAPDCSAAGEYHPEKLITGPIAERTLRRYNLKPDFASTPSPPD
jgi:hypothetical protein